MIGHDRRRGAATGCRFLATPSAASLDGARVDARHPVALHDRCVGARTGCRASSTLAPRLERLPVKAPRESRMRPEHPVRRSTTRRSWPITTRASPESKGPTTSSARAAPRSGRGGTSGRPPWPGHRGRRRGWRGSARLGATSPERSSTGPLVMLLRNTSGPATSSRSSGPAIREPATSAARSAGPRPAHASIPSTPVAEPGPVFGLAPLERPRDHQLEPRTLLHDPRQVTVTRPIKGTRTRGE